MVGLIFNYTRCSHLFSNQNTSAKHVKYIKNKQTNNDKSGVNYPVAGGLKLYNEQTGILSKKPINAHKLERLD